MKDEVREETGRHRGGDKRECITTIRFFNKFFINRTSSFILHPSSFPPSLVLSQHDVAGNTVNTRLAVAQLLQGLH
jgi:hypothetical protein